MRHTFVQTLVCWLCLLTFGLSNGVLSTGAVMCSDDHGSQIEWGCIATDECHKCASEHEPESDGAHWCATCSHEPCNDTFLTDSVGALVGVQGKNGNVPSA